MDSANTSSSAYKKPKLKHQEQPYLSNSDPNSDYYRMAELFHSSMARHFAKNGEVPISIDPQSADPFATAIVPYSNPEAQALIEPVSTRRALPRKVPARSGELVRVDNMNAEEFFTHREKILKARRIYEALRSNLNVTRSDLRAASMMADKDLWLNRDKRVVGEIPGIIVGDVFLFRMELCVLGLHGQVQGGIDFVTSNQSVNREPIATSVIVSGGYEDDDDRGGVIVYTGHGGQDKNRKQIADQKLEGGNLAMERSMSYGVEVRVIRGLNNVPGISGKVYVYDGLYTITKHWFEEGKSGLGVYKFRLERIENQGEMGSEVIKFAANLRTRPLQFRPKGYITLDLSGKKENLPVFFYNDIDSNYDPIHYDYCKTIVFPPHVSQSGISNGCECVGGCFGNECACFVKNGGEHVYDSNGNLLRGKPLVFECGPHCHCSSTCRNRVTQKGITKRLEVFRSMDTDWGVRSLDLIPAGSFICEYAGLVLTRDQVKLLSMNGESCYIYPGRFTEKWKEWGDLSEVIPDSPLDHPSAPSLDFAMDVSRMRNVACYMSNSPTPNVFAQLVLYDHYNVYYPHIMLFALEHIPPLRELSIDYGVPEECTEKLAICN